MLSCMPDEIKPPYPAPTCQFVMSVSPYVQCFWCALSLVISGLPVSNVDLITTVAWYSVVLHGLLWSNLHEEASHGNSTPECNMNIIHLNRHHLIFLMVPLM